MARKRGTTTELGLGQQHRADRERLLALHRDGDPCWRCGQPMYKWQKLDRDHVVDRVLGGTDGPAVLAHQSCNRSAGARLGNQLKPRRVAAAAPDRGYDTVCKTCRKPYHYAARTCEICGAHYHPSGGGGTSGYVQRTCGRTCGIELRRRKYGDRLNSKPPKPKPLPPPKPACTICGKPCSRTYSKFCSAACADVARKDAILQASPTTPIKYYNCRYCGKLGVTRVNAHQEREVCTARECQLARLAANNLVARKGMTRDQADAQVAAIAASGRHGRWQSQRRQPQARSRPHVAPAAGFVQAALW